MSRRCRIAVVRISFVCALIASAVALPAAAADPAADLGGTKPFPPGSSLVPKPSAPDLKPFTLQDRYFDAARRGDLPMLEICIQKGIDPKLEDETGRSALATAVRDSRDLEMVEFLFARGVPMDKPDAVGRTPLHDAAGNGDPSIVTWLIGHGAKVAQKDIQGRVPLHNAVMAGSREVVVILLGAGADANARDNFQDTPLIAACSKGLNEIARVLVEKGADPSLKDQEGRTARERAEETAPFCRDLPVAAATAAAPAGAAPSAAAPAAAAPAPVAPAK